MDITLDQMNDGDLSTLYYILDINTDDNFENRVLSGWCRKLSIAYRTEKENGYTIVFKGKTETDILLKTVSNCITKNRGGTSERNMANVIINKFKGHQYVW